MWCSAPGAPWGKTLQRETLGIDDGSGGYDCDGAGVWREEGEGKGGGGGGVRVWSVFSSWNLSSSSRAAAAAVQLQLCARRLAT